MGRLKKIWAGVVGASRWLARNTRNRLSPRGRVWFDWIVGLTLVLLGLITGPIPVIQGWMFGLPGLVILARRSATARRLLDRIKGVATRARGAQKDADAGQSDEG